MSLFVLFFFLLLLSDKNSCCCLASRHSFQTRHDGRVVIAPIGSPFGFRTGGEYNLTVNDYQFNNNNHGAGFLLKRFDSESAFLATLPQYQSGEACVFEEFLDANLFGDDNNNNNESNNAAESGIFLSMQNVKKSDRPNIYYKFQSKQEEGLYILIYQVCGVSSSTRSSKQQQQERVSSTFELDLVYRNYDSLGYVSYLTAGEMKLPLLFLYFFVGYLFLLGIWVCHLGKIRASPDPHKPKVYAIHQLMTILLMVKTVSILLTSIRYHYIKISGHADLWSVAYYTLLFVKGVFLFVVILLIGSGWSLVKPFLSQHEKRVIFLVLVLQVVDNVALVVLNSETEGESWYSDWSAMLHLVDLICCCAVLIPIVWHVKSLEERTTGETARSMEQEASVQTLEKLKLFRSFYLVVVGYIYFTRIVVYLFSTTLGYQHTWLRYLVTELGTMLFYITTGILFQPMTDNPYLAVAVNNANRDEQEPSNGGLELEMGKLEINIKD